MSWYNDFLKKFFHDPVDKPFDIPTHERRVKEYAEIFGVSGIEEGKYSDQIASCMERSSLPKSKKLTEIRHPLSDEKIKVEGIEFEQAIKKIREILEEIVKEYKFVEDEKKSLLIWRNLLEELIEKTDENLKKFIPLLPAYTRFPDHSIWEHLKISTAINAVFLREKTQESKGQNNSLFLFTIGPVQSFISQARKTQDFFMGSFMLSYLTFVAMKNVIEKYGPTSIIYPDLYRQPFMDWYLENEKVKWLSIKNPHLKDIALPTIPNRFVAIIQTTDETEIKNLANEMRQAIKDEITAARDTIFKELKISLNDSQKNIVYNQLSDFPQIYWVAIPWRKGDRDLGIIEVLEKDEKGEDKKVKKFYKEDLKDFFTDEKLKNWQELWDFGKDKGEYEPNIGFLYQLLYTALEKSMGARKNLREFRQNPEAGRKCSVCGERNVVFFWESKNKDKFKRYNPDALDLTKKISEKYLSDGEGLCSLCLLKRTFDIHLKEKVSDAFKDFSFPSTAEVASADFKEKAIENAKDEFYKFVKRFHELAKKDYLKVKPLPKLENKITENLEGSWFYEENYTEKEGIDINTKEIEELKEKLKKITDKVEKPSPYYAILYLDGDNMGRWLSGELLPEIQHAYNSEVWERLPEEFKKELEKYVPKKILTPAIHSAISTALRNYAIEFVKKIVEKEHLGKLIYAGGDDVLAFVNLRDLFDVMEKLRWAFSGQIKFENGNIEVDMSNTSGFVLKDGVYYLTMGKKATCSMGVVIAHYKEPLKIVIDKVFEMKKEAKKEEKNKFAILLMKRSGEERIGIAEWLIDGNLTTEILKTLKDCMNRENKNYISDGFIQKLKQEFAKIKEKEGSFGLTGEIFNTELKRLLTRAYNGESKSRKEIVEKFYNKAKLLFWRTGEDIDNFTNLLEIASFMNKGE
ncbi:type III-B CRISPR-associated protein Cas10/Cmr2 [Thermodesulfovibrio sp. 3462-1]|uniref:Type III-B CRISPR-associated protein Cas10/Cmr2 n=1 Tax=Thermodesulfovibrio obliviosus TaxID=3118332 RepID=A0AAU8H487_9BACT